jgi:aspartyl-tRNA(Asn)/glutamyl-tRNA(Gln) amidotransferase subunit C
MALNSENIIKIANLARLEMPPEQASKMQIQINGFFDIVEKMQAVDTHGIEPMAHPTHAMSDAIMAAHRLTPIELRLRPDVASEPNNREANQQSAPAVERGLFLVPKVIE